MLFYHFSLPHFALFLILDGSVIQFLGPKLSTAGQNFFFFFFFYHWAEREVPWRRSQRKKFNLVDSFPCIKCFRGQMCVFAGFLRLYESERELIAMVCSINIIRLPSPWRTHTHCRISLKFQEAISHQDENRSDKYFLSPDKRKTISPQVYLEITS